MADGCLRRPTQAACPWDQRISPGLRRHAPWLAASRGSVPRGLAASGVSAFIQVGAVLREPPPALTHHLME